MFWKQVLLMLAILQKHRSSALFKLFSPSESTTRLFCTRDQNSVGQNSGKNYYVYLLRANPSGATYVGATVDLSHRLRQHNREIKGGARATAARVSRGERWERVLYVEGFPDWSAALQFEWRWKHLSRKKGKGKGKGEDKGEDKGEGEDKTKSVQRSSPLERRMQALTQLLGLERATTNAIPFVDWPSGGPNVIHQMNEDM